MRWIFAWLCVGMAAWAGGAAPYEIVSNHTDIEVLADGRYTETREIRYRILTQDGISKMHAQGISFTEGFQRLTVSAAYTQKADGRRIDVPTQNILKGLGQASQEGFQDHRLMTVYFPNLEVGDCIVLSTLKWQDRPWFEGVFDFAAVFDRSVAQKDIVYSITAPESMSLTIDDGGMTAGAVLRGAGKLRREWRYSNDSPLLVEDDAVAPTDFSSHLFVSSFGGYKALAAAYRTRSADQSVPNAEIRTLADTLTKGIQNKREQARILYDWVSTHIAYVGIVLADGGYTPHPSVSVLANLYGDCKDHVALLEALLAAKHIASSPVLIRGGAPGYLASPVASSQHFDHVITYLPEFDLYADSTAEFSPFGTLPDSDAGKTALRIDTGILARTPVNRSQSSTLMLDGMAAIDSTGTLTSHSRMVATGSLGMQLRAAMQSIPSTKEDDILRFYFGPGATGSIERGTPRNLTDPYETSTMLKVPNFLSWSGPTGLPSRFAFLPLSMLDVLTGGLPPSRSTDYVCPSGRIRERVTLSLPPQGRFVSIPETQTVTAPDITLFLAYRKIDTQTVERDIDLKIDHGEAFCTKAYYTALQPELARMVQTLRRQIIVQADGGPLANFAVANKENKK